MAAVLSWRTSRVSHGRPRRRATSFAALQEVLGEPQPPGPRVDRQTADVHPCAPPGVRGPVAFVAAEAAIQGYELEAGVCVDGPVDGRDQTEVVVVADGLLTPPGPSVDLDDLVVVGVRVVPDPSAGQVFFARMRAAVEVVVCSMSATVGAS